MDAEDDTRTPSPRTWQLSDTPDTPRSFPIAKSLYESQVKDVHSIMYGAADIPRSELDEHVNRLYERDAGEFTLRALTTLC